MRHIAIAGAVIATAFGSIVVTAGAAAAEDEVMCAAAETSVNGEEYVNETACLVLPL